MYANAEASYFLLPCPKRPPMPIEQQPSILAPPYPDDPNPPKPCSLSLAAEASLLRCHLPQGSLKGTCTHTTSINVDVHSSLGCRLQTAYTLHCLLSF